jgi:hypothetical protein
MKTNKKIKIIIKTESHIYKVRQANFLPSGLLQYEKRKPACQLAVQAKTTVTYILVFFTCLHLMMAEM